MRPTDTGSQTSAEQSEPQPWRTAEDAKGWRVIGVGKRHPCWLEFEIAAIAARHASIGPAANGAAQDRYRPVARIIAERLRAMALDSTDPEEVFRLTRETLSAIDSGLPPGDDAAYRAEQIPHLTLAQVYAALAYYHANQGEIDGWIVQDEAEATRLERQFARHPGQ